MYIRFLVNKGKNNLLSILEKNEKQKILSYIIKNNLLIFLIIKYKHFLISFNKFNVLNL